MTHPKVQQATGYAATAAELRRIADVLEWLPSCEKSPHTSLSFVLGGGAEEVDRVGAALFGKEGTTGRYTDSFIHVARSTGGAVMVSVQSTVPPPPDERDTEIERLKAELTKYRGESSCLYVLGNGVRCDGPLVWSELGLWVHADHDHDHSAVGPT